MNKARYCSIECKSLEDVQQTCIRHIQNTQKMLLDCIDNADLTDTDAFYLDTMEKMWHDLLQERELLELAAKAAGVKVEHDGKFAFPYGLWNPLDDDGDAL